MSHVPPSGPIRPPTPVHGDPLALRRAVVVVTNADGTVDCKLAMSRAMKSRVPVYTDPAPAVGDEVLLANLDGDPQTPAVVGVRQ